MTLYQILCLIGVPSFISALAAALYKLFKEDVALKKGVQALLRAQMINDYNKWKDRGYAPIYARDNFINCWNQYHGLYTNGVMDDLKSKFLSLPTEKPGRTKENEEAEE